MRAARSRTWRSAGLAGALALPSLSAGRSAAQSFAAPEPGLAALIFAFDRAPVPAAFRPFQASVDRLRDHAQLPPPDSEELAVLRAKLPDVNPASVRIVPAAAVEDLMARAVANKATYMDLLTDKLLLGSETFYVPLSALQVIDQRYVTGALPYSGTAKDGRPFRMAALIAGNGRIDFLYDRTDGFQFDSDGFTFKVPRGGHVSMKIAGPGVLVEIKGAAVYGCRGFLCAWAEFVRWEKAGDKLHAWARAFGMTEERLVNMPPVRAKRFPDQERR